MGFDLVWVKIVVIFGNQVFIRVSSVFSHSLIILPQNESRSMASPLIGIQTQWLHCKTD